MLTRPHRHGVVTPLCGAVLDLLPSVMERSDGWELMGGTGLAEFYLGHRQSDDIDLFTLVEGAVERFGLELVTRLPARLDVSVTTTRVSPYLRRFQLTRNEGDAMKMELILDAPPRFEAPRIVDGMPVGSITDITVGKLGAFISRDEPRDLLDLWAIERVGGAPITGFYAALFEKDPGLAAYPRAVADAWQRHAGRAFWPPMVIHVPVSEDLGAFCRKQESAFFRLLRERAGAPGRG